MRLRLPDRRQVLRATLVISLAGFIGLTAIYLYLAPKLPDIEALKDVRLQVPLRVYSRDGLLIAEYGEMKRVPLRYEQFPQQLVHAVLAAEDNRFFEHPGVDYQGLIRAFIHLVQSGDHGQLGQGQICQIITVVDLGGGGETVGPLAEVDFVQIELKDLLFAQFILNF